MDKLLGTVSPLLPWRTVYPSFVKKCARTRLYFIGAFSEKYQDVLNELVHNKRIKKKMPPYMRPKLRAPTSVSSGTCLFCGLSTAGQIPAFQHEQRQERLFSDLKTKVRAHSGIGKETAESCWTTMKRMY